MSFISVGLIHMQRCLKEGAVASKKKNWKIFVGYMHPEQQSLLSFSIQWFSEDKTVPKFLADTTRTCYILKIMALNVEP